MKAFTKRNVEGTKSARKMHAKLLYPLNAGFKQLIKKPNQKLRSVGSEYQYLSRDMGKGHQCPEGKYCPSQAYYGSFG